MVVPSPPPTTKVTAGHRTARCASLLPRPRLRRRRRRRLRVGRRGMPRDSRGPGPKPVAGQLGAHGGPVRRPPQLEAPGWAYRTQRRASQLELGTGFRSPGRRAAPVDLKGRARPAEGKAVRDLGLQATPEVRLSRRRPPGPVCFTENKTLRSSVSQLPVPG